MKKSFVITLTLVFLLGLAGTTFANPFNDLPANHWAYASVSKLAQAGIIDGYGDGKFIGSSNMTRFEMAQIVAKAMANSDKADAATKAQIEKLAAEFSTELNKLGVRVTTLDKKVDNVKITGEIRFGNGSYSNVKIGDKVLPASKTKTEDFTKLRSRLWLTGNVNDNWSYTAMLENIQNLTTNNQDATTKFLRAFVEGKIGTIGVKAGSFNTLSLYGTILDDTVDGLALNYVKNKFKIEIFAFRSALSNLALSAPQKNLQTYGAQIHYNFDAKWHAGATYYDLQGKDSSVPNKQLTNTSIFELGVDYKFDKNWFAWAQYIKGGKLTNLQTLPYFQNANLGSKNGWAAGINFGNIDRNQQGSYQLRLSYYDIPVVGSISTPLEFSSFASLGVGFNGYVIGGSYMLAKNIDLSVDYYDFKSSTSYNGDKAKGSLLFSCVRFYF